MEKSIAIEYLPWSKKVLNYCLQTAANGGIPCLDIELTSKCTGACCIYCDSKPSVCAHSNPDEIVFEDLKRIILESKKQGLQWVYTCGLGEPLEDKKFWKMLELFSENDIYLSMFSNGVFIQDKKTAERLKSHNVNIILKMDTFNEQNFDAILGYKGVAKKIYKARDLLLEAGYGADQNGYTNLAFSIVPTSLSIDSIPDVVEFCKKNGIFASIGELEQAGEVIKNNLVETLGINKEQILNLQKIANDYIGGIYKRPICPCIMTGVHIDNIGNCLVDKDTGLNCKWFLLKNPSVYCIGDIYHESIQELYNKVINYRLKAFESNKIEIENAFYVDYVFGGCGGNPKDIIKLVMEQNSQ